MSEQQTIEAELMTGREFAEHCGVTEGRVSQWKQEGKIHGDALVGKGRRVKINASLAKKQLGSTLDVGQKLGNGLGTRLGEPETNSVEDKIKAIKLEQAERKNRQEHEDDLARRGVYMETHEARRQMQNVANLVLRVFEGGLNDVAGALASKFELSNRDVQHTLRLEFNKIRARSSEALKQQQKSMNDTVPSDTFDA